MKFSKSRELFYRQITFYTALVLLPVLIFIAFINNFLIRNLQSEYNKNSRQVLRQLIYYTETNLANIDTIKDYLLQERRFPVTMQIEDVNKAQSIMHNLTKHTISNNFLDDMVLHFRDDRYVYTSGTTYTVEAFTDYYLNVSPDKREEFTALLERPDDSMIFPLARFCGSGNEVAVLYPLEFSHQEASLMFLFNPASAQSLSEGEIVVALTQDQTPVFYKNVPQGKKDDVLAEILAADPLKLLEEEKTAEIKLHSLNEKYLMLSMRSEQIPWTYVYLSPMRTSYSDLYRLQTYFIAIIIVILILSVLLIRYGVKLNYKPISKLAGQAAEYGEEAEGKGEIEQIQSALNYLATQNASLKNLVTGNEKSKIVRALMRGTDLEEAGMSRSVDLALPLFNKPFYTVHVLAAGEHNMHGGGDLTEAIAEQYAKHFESYVLPLFEENHYGILLAMDEEEKALYNEHVRATYTALKAAHSGPLLLCLGGIKDDIHKVSQSYYEALMAYEYAFVKGQNTIIRSEELELLHEQDPSYPNHLFNRISFNLKNGDCEETLAALNELADYIKEDNLSLYFAKGLCYQLINTVSTVILELNNELKLSGAEINYAGTMSESATVDTIVGEIRRLIEVICRRVQEAESSGENKLADQMISYIDENFDDINFSVQNMADDFNMPISSLSLFFKRQHNTTISNYLTTVRMNRAKELMLETELPLSDITYKVGYLNPSSFIRKFKNLYGLTPGQWSKENKMKYED